MMVEELLHISEDVGDPVGILMAASLVREDLPWLYELAMEVYRSVKRGDPEVIEGELRRLHYFSERTAHGPLMEEFGFGGRESHMLAIEFPKMLEHFLARTLELTKPLAPPKIPKRRPPV